MTEFVLFQMWEQFRQFQIEQHLFYNDQARIRLLSQFSNMESDADNASTEWLNRASIRFNPDIDDVGSIYEAANEEGIAFYLLLESMRDNVRLSVVAGMFHEWEKQLRDWTFKEIRRWHHGDEVRAKIWSQDLSGLVDLFAGLGWDIRNRPYFNTLDACRLVVNTYKHGDGTSFRDLKQRYPEYIHNPLKGIGDEQFGMSFSDHTNLKVSEAHIDAFADAITAFWKDVPTNIYKSSVISVPKWFEKAWKKDLEKN